MIIAALGLTSALLLQVSGLASPLGGFGPGIEDYPRYDGQDTCSPHAKPGVLAFQSLIMNKFYASGGGISRACDVGGQSEHKEGRAWDWSMDASDPAQKDAADRAIEWLTKQDRYGNEAARARRLGVMYLIWNRQIWFPHSGWSTYCVQKSFGCHTPGDKESLRHPHTDHVHFSFTWDGAKKKTTYWNRDRSMISDMGAPPEAHGYWLVGGNGGIAPKGVGFYGSRSDRAGNYPVVGVASTPTGNGYWLAYANGKVVAFGDARSHGNAQGETKQVADIVVSATGKGYWLLTSRGRVFAFGDAQKFGGSSGETTAPVVGLAATPTGLGYWLVTSQGRVAAFGDAKAMGGLGGKATDFVGIVATPSGKGYWIYSARGKVAAFGDARFRGGLVKKGVHQPIVGMAPSASGHGYWLSGAKGKVWAFGDAPKLGSARSLARTAAAEQDDHDDYNIPEVFPDH